MADPYTSKNGVLFNKFGIDDAETLREVEYDLVATRAEEILKGHVALDVTGYGLERQIAIHKHLFQDVYEWAGKTRTTSLSKRMGNGMVSVFVEPVAIKPYWELLEQKIKDFLVNDALTFEQQREILVKIFVEANNIHPFPEGNGRSLQIFMKQLARERRIDLDYTKVDPRQWNYASAVSGTYGKVFEHQYLIPEPPNHERFRTISISIASPVAAECSIRAKK